MAKYLTKYSFEIVLKEFDNIYTLKSNVSEEGHIFSDWFLVLNNGGCNCPFKMSMDLPFCHILSARKNYNFSLVDKSLCSKKQRRFNEALRIMKNVATRVSEKTGSDYDYWISELGQLVKCIENDEKIILEKVNNSTTTEKHLSNGNSSLPVLTCI